MASGPGQYGSMSTEYRDDPYKDANNYDNALNKTRGKVSAIRSLVSQLEDYFRKMNTVGGASRDARSKVLALETEINETIDSTNLLLRNLNNYRVNDRVLKLKADKIRRDLDTAIGKYRDLTQAISEMMKSMLANNPDEAQLVDTGEPRSAISQQEQLNIEADLALQLEQEQEMQRLAGNVEVIEEMFRDLNAQVVEQREGVDSIANNLDEARYTVEDANQQLLSAVEYKRKVRKRCIIIVIVVLVLLGIIGLIIGIEVKK